MQAPSALSRLATRFGIAPLCILASTVLLPSSSLFAVDRSIAVGDDFTAVIDSNNRLYTFGSNASGQLGIGSVGDSQAAVELVTTEEEWQAVAVSRSIDGSGVPAHVLAIKTDGSLWAWGANEGGQLGIGTTVDASVPVQVGSDTDWVEIAAGSNFSLARKADGRVYAWGDNAYGQLALPIKDKDPQGIGLPESTRNTYTTPQLFDGGQPYIAIAAGPRVGLGIRSTWNALPLSATGPIYSWGYSESLQLGKPANAPAGAITGPTSIPQQIGSSEAWTAAFCGETICFALQDGQLYVWGGGGHTGIGAVSYMPTRVGSASNWARVSIGNGHTLALRSDGSLYGWGDNQNGQLGLPLRNADGTYNFSNYFLVTPRLLEVGSTFTAIGAGADFSIIMASDGSVSSSGGNSQGQLGNGDTFSVDVFGQTNLGAVDLEIESISYISPEEDLEEGDTLQIQLIVRNNGTGTVEAAALSAITYAFSLSPSTNPNTSGQLNVQASAPVFTATEIGPSSAIPVSFTLTIPDVLAGDYYILSEVDTGNVVEESDENNNISSSDPEEPIEFRADLQVSFIAATPTTVEANETMTVEFTLSNLGTGEIPAGAAFEFNYMVILAENDEQDIGDVFELALSDGTTELTYSDGLDAGATTSTLAVELLIPEEVNLSKTYYVGIIVDTTDTISETDEFNNTAFSNSPIVNVTGLSIPAALDIEGDPNQPLLTTVGDSNWFGQPNVANATGVDNGAARSPSLEEGEFAAMTLSFDVPREVTFRWKSETTSSANRLFFGANLVALEPEGLNQPSYLFGNRDWSEVSFIVPKNTPVGFFYEQQTEAPSDRVFVDDLRIGDAITEPDYIVQSIDYTVGDYVLRRDRFSVVVTGINRGEDAVLPDDFDVKVWLSLDQNAGDDDDVLLGSLNSFQILDNGSRFVYQAEFVLPDELLDASYYVLARVDSTNVVAEYNEDTPFSLGDNNFRFSDEPGVVIDRRADLRATNLAGGEGSTQQTSIFVGGPTDHPDYNRFAGENETKVFGQFIIEPISGDNSEIAIRFDVLNDGLAAVEGLGQAFGVDVYLVPSREISPENGFLLTSFVESGGLAVGSGRSYEITSNIPNTVEPGQFYYVAIVLDASNAVAESNEENNSTFSAENEAFVGEVPLEVALNDGDLDDPGRADPNLLWETREWFDGFQPSNVTQSNPSSPWFGQKDIFGIDSIENAAAQSGPVRTGATSFMETVVEVGDNPLQVAFYWRVSSQFEVINGAVFEDILEFSIREGDSGPFERISKISGEVDWTLLRHTIQEPGTYTLRWSYIENGDGGRAGADAGWVDAFTSVSPDFTLSDPGNPNRTPSLNVDVAGPVDVGDTIDVSFNTLNLGAVAYDQVRVQIRLSQSRGVPANLDWSTAGSEDVTLFDGFATIGETFSQTLPIPEWISESGDYYVGAWLEYDKQIAESDETNNLAWTETPLVQLVPSVTFGSATEFQPDPTNGWTLVGDDRWFPTISEVHPDSDQEASVTNPALNAGQAAGFEAIIDGPLLLKFRWKADSRESLNYAEVRINGVVQRREFGPNTGSTMRISGVQDWQEEYLLIPSGTQVVSWYYVKNAEPQIGGGDNVYVDYIEFLDVVDRPDLAVLDVDYNFDQDPNNAVVQYALERDQFPISVILANRGSKPAGFDYDDVDIEVRLSDDRSFDETDQIIGNLGLTQVVDNGNRLVYSGDVDLPINLDDQTYYLLVRVNSLDPNFQEFSVNIDGTDYELLDNNQFISEDQDIEILHLPRLITELKTLINDKIYYPKESLYIEWDLINIGLGDIDGLTPFETRIELWAYEAGADLGTLDAASYVRDLAVITEQEYLPGVLSRDNASESTLSYQEFVKIPRAGQLLTDLGVVAGSPEDEDVDVVSNLSEIANRVYFIVIVRDTEIEQSSDLSIRYFNSQRFRITAVPNTGISFDGKLGTFWDYDTWQSYQSILFSVGTALGYVPDLPTASPGDVGTNSGLPYLYHYALNLPLDSVPGATPSNSPEPEDVIQSGTYQVRDGASNTNNYRSITFPILRGATDLIYQVVVSNDGGNSWTPEPLIEIRPPYLDTRSNFQTGYYGAQSLTLPVDSESLINAEVNPGYPETGDTNKPVMAAVDQNYTAIVTVRDIIDLQTLVDDTVVANTEDRRLGLRVTLVNQNQNTSVVKNAVLAPFIVSQSPGNIQLAAGDPLFLAVQAYGGDLTYEWFTTAEALDALDGAKVSSNGSSLNIPSADAGHAGTYYVRISNQAGSIESIEMVVSVGDVVNPPEESWYADAAELADGWRYLEWFKAFKPVSGNWLYHARHGWFYAIAEDSSSLFLWDEALARWLWTSETVYPWIYAYGSGGGWLFFFEDVNPGSRFFGRGDTGEIVSEESLRLTDD